MSDQKLTSTIAKEISRLEDEGEIVLTCSSVDAIAERIASGVLEVVPQTDLTTEELGGVMSLIIHAISDENFFDWEMPTLTGFQAEEFRAIAQKLRRH